MNGNRNLSSEAANLICIALGLEGDYAEYFRLLVSYEQTQDVQLRLVFSKKLQQLNPSFPSESQTKDLSIDAFRAISEWYHVAILEMTQLNDASVFTPTRIAKRIGISPLEAQQAIERLLRLELLEKLDDGTYQKTHHIGLFETKNYSQALRKFHKQLLDKATAALEHQPPEEAIFGSYTFSVDPKKIPDARRKLAQMGKELVNLFGESKKRSETYSFAFGLFSLTSKNKEPHS